MSHPPEQYASCLHAQQRGWSLAPCLECADIDSLAGRLDLEAVDEPEHPLLGPARRKLAEMMAPLVRALVAETVAKLSQALGQSLLELDAFEDAALALRNIVFEEVEDQGICTYDFHWTEAIDHDGKTCQHCGEPLTAHHVIRVCPREGCTPAEPYDLVVDEVTP